ncbi:hypothetical protein [Winogradskyella sp.]|uniref:hypothetical protein n=1 Tax=Winogradskyella sp. TaxID=1883156 RepID=UPI0025F7E65A|nr:hypothetical protein [Winogradskyella sp.]MBT8246149.1 hypothetical protein [Winogradskyella sp.]
MQKKIFIIALTLISISVSAHNPNTASVVINPINGVWVAQFTISQEGANYALNSYYADKDLNSIEVAEYKELYIDYLRKKISLIVDDTKVSLSSAGIKLGNHQTDIKFLIPDFPKNYNTIKLNLPMFEENEQQNTVVKFLEDNKSIRKVLNQSNKFEMIFKNNTTEFISVNAKKMEFNKIIYGIIAFLLITAGVYFYRTRNKTVANNV